MNAHVITFPARRAKEALEVKKLIRVLIALTIVMAVDWLTKNWAERTLPLSVPTSFIGQFFRLTLGYNTGVSFGMFANGGLWPLIITGLVIVGLVVWLLSALRTGELPRMAAWPIGLILGGAIANFIDRLPDGRVTDFLDVGYGATRWPTFNLADTFIVIGVALLLLFSLMDNQHEAAKSENIGDSN